jgi:hypothetical protein
LKQSTDPPISGQKWNRPALSGLFSTFVPPKHFQVFLRPIQRHALVVLVNWSADEIFVSTLSAVSFDKPLAM